MVNVVTYRIYIYIFNLKKTQHKSLLAHSSLSDEAELNVQRRQRTQFECFVRFVFVTLWCGFALRFGLVSETTTTTRIKKKYLCFVFGLKFSLRCAKTNTLFVWMCWMDGCCLLLDPLCGP